MSVTIYIRGQDTPFEMFDETPAWQEYIEPISESWRYVQVRLGDLASESASPSASPSAGS